LNYGSLPIIKRNRWNLETIIENKAKLCMMACLVPAPVMLPHPGSKSIQVLDFTISVVCSRYCCLGQAAGSRVQGKHATIATDIVTEDIQDMEKKVKKANIATCKEATQRFGAE